RAAGAARGDDRDRLPRDDHDRVAAPSGRSRVPRARDCRGRDAGRPGARQSGVARRPGAERHAGVRGLRQARRGQQSAGQGSPGTRDEGIPAVKRFFLTTAIDYVNSRPHLGTAYEKICADVIARYKRLCGFEIRFLMGNDAHSQNGFKKAVEEGLNPLAYCDQMEREFRKTWAHLDVSFDDFIRTTEPRHTSGVTKIATRVWDASDIYEGVYEGWYCVTCEEFKKKKDLVNAICPLHPTL